MIRIIFICIISLGYSQKIDSNDRYYYYGTIAGLYGLTELIPDHDPWMSSDTLKQYNEASNTIPTTYLVSINISYFSLLSYSISNDFTEDAAGLNHTIGHIETLIAQHGVTRLVKKLVARERPNSGKDKVSFWSGHASTAFPTATYSSLFIHDHTSISEEGKLAFSILNFAYAGYVGWTRIDDYQHHTSDVIVGAMWGILASSYIYKIRNDQELDLFKGQKKSNRRSNRAIIYNFSVEL